MTETTKFKIGADASCLDGVCGKVTSVVIDPISRSVTHLVVQPKHLRDISRLVPLDLLDVDEGTDEVRLRCNTEQLEQLDPAEETHFLTEDEDEYGGYGPGQVYAWPYYGLDVGLGVGVGPAPLAVTYDTLPLGEVSVRRGEQVHASDGNIGQVQGLVIAPPDHRVTHVLLQEGHFWGRKQVAIPITAVTRVDDGISVNLTKRQIQDLPPVDVGQNDDQTTDQND